MQEYEGAVEDRNHTGIMLIDRNDELCILYEKANTQEEVMRKGNAHLTFTRYLSLTFHFSRYPYVKSNTQEEVMRKGNTHFDFSKVPVTHLCFDTR